MIKVSFNLPQLLETWGAVIGSIESAVDGVLGKDEFLNTFKDTLIENADEYPLLDPFAAKFQYRSGEVTYTGEVTKNLSQGIGKSLWEATEALVEKAALDGSDLNGPIQASLGSIRDQYQDMIDRFNISGILPDLFQ